MMETQSDSRCIHPRKLVIGKFNLSGIYSKPLELSYFIKKILDKFLHK